MEKLRARSLSSPPRPFRCSSKGESGSGKELVAHSLHRLSAARRRPYLTLNCAAIAPTLVEPTLFGYAKGAFTGAHGEQGRLLRGRPGRHAVPRRDRRAAARAAGEAPARARERRIPARGRDAAPRLARPRHRRHQPRPAPRGPQQGGFRADLYHRLSVLHAAACRRCASCDGDRLALLEHFRRLYARAGGRRSPSSLDDEAEARWLRYDVPGQRARAAQHRDPPHHQVRRPAGVDGRARARARPRGGGAGRGSRCGGALVEQAQRQLERGGAFNLDETLKAWERAYIDAALRLTRGNISQAAKLLGVNRTTLYSRIECQAKRSSNSGGAVPRTLRTERAAVPHHAAHRLLLRRRRPRRRRSRR